MLKAAPQPNALNAARTNGRGRIPRAAWPAIVSRRDSGEPLSCIARSYGVTPSAVNYVLKKSKTPDRGDSSKPDESNGRGGDPAHRQEPATPPADAPPDPSGAVPPAAPHAARPPHAARLATAAETCCAVLDGSGLDPVMTEDLKAAIHEVRRSLAAIEIAAAKQTTRSRR